MRSLWQRVKNLWFLSGISSEDIRKAPENFLVQAANKDEIRGMGYVVGLTESESSFAQTLNADGRDTYIL